MNAWNLWMCVVSGTCLLVRFSVFLCQCLLSRDCIAFQFKYCLYQVVHILFNLTGPIYFLYCCWLSKIHPNVRRPWRRLLLVPRSRTQQWLCSPTLYPLNYTVPNNNGGITALLTSNLFPSLQCHFCKWNVWSDTILARNCVYICTL